MQLKNTFRQNFLKILMIGLIIIVPIFFYGCAINNDYSGIPSKSYIPTDTEIFVDELGYNSIRLKEDRDIRVLQITDIHIGNGIFSVKKDRKALEDVCALIEYSNPDLIVLTGDIVYPLLPVTGTNDNLSALILVAKLIETYKTPWTFVFGNHDAESFAQYSKSELCDYLESDQLNYCLFERGFSDLEGMGNHIVNVYNNDNTINSSLVMFDNGEYKGGMQLSGYKPISQAQTDWYTDAISEISDFIGHTIQSFIFQHVPSKTYDDAWKEYRFDESSEIIYYYGWANEKNEEISSPSEDGSLWDAILELESTKGIFCGHNHLNDFSISYQGVRLTFGKSIDYLAYLGILNKKEQRGATLLVLQSINSSIDESFDIIPIKIMDIK